MGDGTYPRNGGFPIGPPSDLGPKRQRVSHEELDGESSSKKVRSLIPRLGLKCLVFIPYALASCLQIRRQRYSKLGEEAVTGSHSMCLCSCCNSLHSYSLFLSGSLVKQPGPPASPHPLLFATHHLPSKTSRTVTHRTTTGAPSAYTRRRSMLS